MAGPSEPVAPRRVIMVCAGGLSSSLVETHLRQAAEARGVALEIRSMSVIVLELMELGAAPMISAILVAPQAVSPRRAASYRPSNPPAPHRR